MNVEELNSFVKNSLIEHLGICFTCVEADKVVATMPVDHRTMQPMKILHGGANMALAETVGSAGSFLLVDPAEYTVVGLEINGNHVRPATEGIVTGTATLVHKGKKTHVWNIEIRDERDMLVSICRITNMIIKK